MATEAQKRASQKYKANKTKSIRLELNIEHDADIIARLDEVGNRQGYVKELIRRDMNRRCKNCLFYERFDGLCSDYCSASCVHNGDFTETGYCSFFEAKT